MPNVLPTAVPGIFIFPQKKTFFRTMKAFSLAVKYFLRRTDPYTSKLLCMH